MNRHFFVPALLLLAPRPARAAVADLHLHARMDAALPALFRGHPTGESAGELDGDERLRNAVSLRDLEEADVRLVLATLYSFPVVGPLRGGPLEDLLRQARAVEDWARAEGAALVRDPAELRAALAGTPKRLAVVLAAEGTHGVEDEAALDALWKAGVRMLTVAHLEDSPWAGAARVRYWPATTCRPRGLPDARRGELGLTPLGRRLSDHALGLGLVLDLAHASDRSFFEFAERYPGLPLMVSHTMAREITPCERAEDPARLRLLKASGGRVGLTVNRDQLGPRIEDAVLHAKALAREAGPGALALGSDLNGFIRRVEGMESSAGLGELLDALEGAGLPEVRLSAEAFAAFWERYLEKARGLRSPPSPAAAAPVGR